MSIDKQQFMNLLTDYAFKRIFGTEENKSIAIRFLNTLFEGELTVNDIKYHDKEMLPAGADGKRIIYDVYCTNVHGNNEHFIIEMQQADKGIWQKRTIFYTAAAIVGQGRQGFDYDINPVFSIFLQNFDLSHMEPAMKHDVRFMDVESKQVYSDDVRMIFLSLKQVPATWEECNTELEKVLYLIKNMHTMDKQSKPYTDNFFEEIFNASSMASLAAEDVVPYSQSLQRLKDDQVALEYTAKKAEERGMAKGIEKGRAEGRAEGIEEGIEKGMLQKAFDMARKLLKAGMSQDFVKDMTGLSSSELATLM